jgi:hypothetical protein
MKTLIIKAIKAAAIASAVVMPVGATTVSLAVDGKWQTFDVDNSYALSSGLEWIDAQSKSGYNNDGSALDFKFDLQSAAILTVVDGGFSGDQFQVFDNGVALGYTSVATNSYPNSLATDFTAALADSHYSRGVFYLQAGQHDITGLLALSALDDSNTAINATVGAVNLTAVPVPASLGFFLAGSGLLGAFSRRRV